MANKVVKKSRIAILGLTFKENTPDTRNSKVIDIIEGLREFGIEPIIVDPIADKKEAKREYDIELTDLTEVENLDCVVLAVAHKDFGGMGIRELDKLFGEYDNEEKIIVDIKSILSSNDLKDKGYSYWRL